MQNIVKPDPGLKEIDQAAGGLFKTGENGVLKIYEPLDQKIALICYKDRVLTYVRSKMGYPAIYPLYPCSIKKPLKAILMDLDGTSVRSEEFWIWIIQMTIASLIDNNKFKLEDSDLPHVSGHSVSEHLAYCIQKYCPDKTLEKAREYYFEHTHTEMKAILDGKGRTDAFIPAPGLKEFLLAVKDHKIKIGLVTSGLYEKAFPEILSAFKTLKMGDPLDFYDAIITAGYTIRKGQCGTMGELSPKPHPWLYAETARLGLGIDFNERDQVIGFEDSSAGVISIRLAGFTAIAINGGNIKQSGVSSLSHSQYDNLADTLPLILS